MATADDSEAVEVFVSYSHEDEEFCKELKRHLSALTHEGKIRVWHDREVLPGGDWKGAIDRHMESAGIILLLVSPAFLDSGYCWGMEVTKALARHAAGDAWVVPVILRPVDWTSLPIARLQALPKDARPVTLWANRDEAFRDVARSIRRLTEEKIRPSPKPSLPLGKDVEPASADSERRHEVDGSDLVYIQGGEVTLGSDNAYDNVKPAHRVHLAPFWIGKHPVTNEQYRRFLEQSGSGFPEPLFWADERFNGPRQPVVGIDWTQAHVYCEWAGLSLPSEAQWETAARGLQGRPYPWGDQEPDAERASFAHRLNGPSQVDDHPAGSTPEGVLDLAGNVWEWCQDIYDDEAYRSRRDREENPLSMEGDPAAHVVRGGSWRDAVRFLSATYRVWLRTKDKKDHLGLRVCLNT